MSQFIEMFKCSAEGVALSSLCDTFIDGDWIEAKDQSDSGIRLIQTGNVGVGTFKDKGDKARYISEDTFNRLNCTEVVEGDILISRLPDPVGRACIIPAGLGKSITAVDCTIIRLNDKVLPKFFVAFTSTPDYAMQIKKVLSGTTRLRVSRANLGKIQVPLPSVDKQQQFVTIAEQADKSGFDGRKSQFIEMFYNEKYPLQKLKTHIDVVRGVSYKPVDIKEAGSYRSSVILRSNNIDNGQINFDDVVYVDNRRVTKEQVLSKGDIVMCGSNGSKKLVGKAAMINEIPSYRTSFGAFCIGIRCKESILPKYLSVYFQTSKYRDVIEFLGSGSNILNIKPEHIYNLEIPIPSLEDQKHFVSIAEQADKSGSVLQHMIAC